MKLKKIPTFGQQVKRVCLEILRKKWVAHFLGHVIKILNGSKRFEGYVESFLREERDGFMCGNIIFEGGKEFKGETFKIWFKNENLIAWRNDKLDFTCPDAIVIVDSQKGEGLSNWGDHFYKGREVTIIGIRSLEIWRSEKGLEIFGPKHFGFDFSHKDSNYSQSVDL